jgi:ATP-dependent DNA helicase PIF1
MDILLSDEQQQAFNKFIIGENVFITGSAGSGKSELIRRIYNRCISIKTQIQVCALTGCASLLLKCKAKTIHSWSGIGLGTSPINVLIDKINSNYWIRNAWKEISVLVIDEISMMSLKLFNMLDAIGKEIRGNYTKPFGGIQLIFSGDFYQLPPVGNIGNLDTIKFCFESEYWNDTFKKDCQIKLIKIFRQTDNIYVSILNQIREGRIKRSSSDLLIKRIGVLPPDGMAITQLYPRRNSVENVNFNKMKELTSEEKIFEIKLLTNIPVLNKTEKKYISKFSKIQIDTELQHIKSNLLCETSLKLKIGAFVMCIVNLEVSSNIGLCNGSQGIIIGFDYISGLPIVKYNNGCEVVMGYHTWASDNIPGIGVSQIPLILAWAITIHKSQGTTLDMATIDVGNGIFETGQTYVALSRVKTLDGLYLISFDINKIKINSKVQQFYNNLLN